MIQVKSHTRKRKNGVSVVRKHSRSSAPYASRKSPSSSKSSRSRKNAGHHFSPNNYEKVGSVKDFKGYFSKSRPTDRAYVGKTKGGVYMKIIGGQHGSSTQAMTSRERKKYTKRK